MMAHTAGSATECGPLGLFSLFSASRIFEDTNQDGYPDRLGSVIEVDPQLYDASIWAQVLNLAARLAIEVTALDLPLVRPMRSKSGNQPALVVLSPDPNLPAAAEIKHQKPARVTIGGHSPQSMARVIAGLALSPASGGLLSQNWHTIRLAEPEARAMEISYGRHSTMERIPLPPFPTPGKPR